MTKKKDAIRDAKVKIKKHTPIKTLTDMGLVSYAEEFLANPHDLPTKDCYCLYCIVERTADAMASGLISWRK